MIKVINIATGAVIAAYDAEVGIFAEASALARSISTIDSAQYAVIDTGDADVLHSGVTYVKVLEGSLIGTRPAESADYDLL